MISKIKIFFFSSSVLILTYFCLKFPEIISTSITESVNRCFSIIIPSMFMFMCLSSVMASSGLHRILGYPFRIISEKLFRIPPEGFAIFLLSMISGYPAGIKMIGDTYQNGELTFSQARRMSCFCFSSGPAFISGTVTAVLYPDTNTCVIIFLSILSGNIISALISAFTSKEKLNCNSRMIFSLKTNTVISSIRSASGAMMQMCIMVVAFNGFCSILKYTGVIQAISILLSSCFSINTNIAENIVMSSLEISNIINFPTMNPYLLPVISFLLSFGGICVLMQVMALSSDFFSISSFIKYRLISSFVSGIACRLLMHFSDISDSCSTGLKTVSENKYSPVPSLFLIIMVIILLSSSNNLSIKKETC